MEGESSKVSSVEQLADWVHMISCTQWDNMQRSVSFLATATQVSTELQLDHAKSDAKAFELVTHTPGSKFRNICWNFDGNSQICYAHPVPNNWYLAFFVLFCNAMQSEEN